MVYEPLNVDVGGSGGGHSESLSEYEQREERAPVGFSAGLETAATLVTTTSAGLRFTTIMSLRSLRLLLLFAVVVAVVVVAVVELDAF